MAFSRFEEIMGKKQMTVYISGPITFTNDWTERFAKAEEELKAKGYNVVNPITVGAELENRMKPEIPTWADYMKVDIKALMDCDAIYMLKDWFRSRGALVEHNLALKLGLKILGE